jgi:Peptidase S24-like
MAYRQWLPNPAATVGVRLTDDAMYPILPSGSVVAIDRSKRDVWALQGRMVAATYEGAPMIRWLDITGRHMILRPNQPSREHPLIPIELDNGSQHQIIGQVVWSWSRFGQE